MQVACQTAWLGNDLKRHAAKTAENHRRADDRRPIAELRCRAESVGRHVEITICMPALPAHQEAAQLWPAQRIDMVHRFYRRRPFRRR